MYIDRVKLSDEARSVIEQLRDKHGELIFHQSGGCCDGSAPMCFPKDDFLIGSRDLFLGEIHGCRFYMAPDQFEYYRNMQITIEVTQGRGSSFSLEIPLGVRFMTVSRVLTDQELEKVRPLET